MCPKSSNHRLPKPQPDDHPLIASTFPGLLGSVTSADGLDKLGGFSLFFLLSLATVISADGIDKLGGFSLFFLLSLATVISAAGLHKCLSAAVIRAAASTSWGGSVFFFYCLSLL